MSEKAKSRSTKPVSDASTAGSSSAAGEILPAANVQPAVRPTSQRLADLGARWKGEGGVSPQNTTSSDQRSAPAAPPAPSDEATGALVDKLKRTGGGEGG